MSLKTWYIATRPWSLVMTFVSTCLAGVLAYADGEFSVPIFILTMMGLIIAHIAANMANDWYDVKNKVDENAPTAKYRPHPLLAGDIEKSEYKKVVFAVYSVGILIGLYLTWLRGLPVLVFTVLGVLFGVFYNVDPVKLKYRALGEISVFLAFGPLMVGGAYYAVTGTFSWTPMIASIPIGLLVALVLLANNIRDREYDASLGITTMTTNKGVEQGVTYYRLLLVSAYVVTIVLIIEGTLSLFSLVTLLSLKEAYNIFKSFGLEVPLNSDQITAQLALHFGILLTLGEILNILSQTFL